MFSTRSRLWFLSFWIYFIASLFVLAAQQDEIYSMEIKRAKKSIRLIPILDKLERVWTPEKSASDTISFNPRVEFLGAGKISYFGGPNDIYDGLTAITQIPGKQLNPKDLYCAFRWNYKRHSKEYLLDCKVRIEYKGKVVYARPVDYGPGKSTGRIIDVSLGVMNKLGVETDEVVKVYLVGPEPTEKRDG